MENNFEITISDETNLLDVFVDDNDKKGNDLLSMSDVFNVLAEHLGGKIARDTGWDIYGRIEGLTGEIATAIKAGYEISQAGILVADYSHFSKGIIDGLKKGIYHIGQSKEVAGNLRPAILDDKEQLVKFFTLKKALNPASILSDVSTLSMQLALQNISAQIDGISNDVKYLADHVRRENLSVPFLNARDRIMRASTSSKSEENKFLEEADIYLMEGINKLKADINVLAEQLATNNRPTIKTIDSVLEYFNEDMQILSKYVGMRVYLFNYRGKIEDAKRILGEYKYQLQSWGEMKLKDSRYSVFELIHEYYPYADNNRDFWLEKPEELVSEIDAYDSMLDQKDKDILYITVEEFENES